MKKAFASWAILLLASFAPAFAQGQSPSENPPSSPTSPAPSPTPSPTSPPPPSTVAPPTSSPTTPKAEVVSPDILERFLRAAKEEILLLTTTASYDSLMTSLWPLAKKGIRILVMAPQSAITPSSSYLVSLAFLSLKHPNVTVKLLGGSKVDPRLIIDRKYMLVGPPLEGIPPEAGGPLLLVTDPAMIKVEVDRFFAYWSIAPYCAPRVKLHNDQVLPYCTPNNQKY